MELDFPIIKEIVRKSFDKMLKSLKFMLQSQVSKWSETTSFTRFLWNMKFPFFWLPWRKNDVFFCRSK